tara:strand:- start:541 stop:1806 length:1266 start_codon:yes stop_codon:yes gene_type:complete
MAIDYSGYAGAYGGAGGGQMGGAGGGQGLFAQGVSQALSNMPTAAEKLESNQLQYFSNLANQLTPTFSIDEGKLTTMGGVSEQALQSLPDAWAEYKKTIGNRIRPNEFTLFKEKYDNLIADSGAKLIQKFTLMSQEGVKNSTIREHLRANPKMRQTLVSLGMQNPELLSAITPFLSEGIGIVPGIMEEGGELAGAASPLLLSGAARAVGGAWKGGPKGALDAAKKGFMRGVMPGGAIGVGGKLTGFRDPKKLAPGKALRGGAVARATKAKDAYMEARKKSKLKVSEFKKTKKGKSLLKAKDVAAKAKSTALKSPAAKSGMNVIKRYIKRHGTSGLIKTLAKRMGTKGALKLVAKLGLSAGMKVGGLATGGLTTAASLALDAYTIYQVANILKDVVSEEAGGIRAPQKMLFGSGKSLEGTTF